ncbi:unnamed protein product, partial [Allacma fusca]
PTNNWGFRGGSDKFSRPVRGSASSSLTRSWTSTLVFWRSSWTFNSKI